MRGVWNRGPSIALRVRQGLSLFVLAAPSAGLAPVRDARCGGITWGTGKPGHGQDALGQVAWLEGPAGVGTPPTPGTEGPRGPAGVGSLQLLVVESTLIVSRLRAHSSLLGAGC